MEKQKKRDVLSVLFNPKVTKTVAGVVLLPVAGFLAGHPADCTPMQSSEFFACTPGMRHQDHIEESTGNVSLSSTARASLTVTTSASTAQEIGAAIFTLISPSS